MYYKVKIEDTVRIPPERFNEPPEKVSVDIGKNHRSLGRGKFEDVLMLLYFIL